MLAAKIYDFGDIRLEEMERPRVGADDILVRAVACGLCSSDFLPWYVKRKAPFVLGHEPVGVVEEIGENVRGFCPGQRVFVHHHAPCWQCAPCRRGEYVQCPTWRSSKLEPGGMAEFFVVSPINQRDTLVLPAEMSDLDGVLIEPVACALKAMRRADIKPGETVVVLGLGIMGIINVALARHLGAGLVIGVDLVEQRAVRATRFGADLGLTVSEDNFVAQLAQVTGGAMADVVIVGPGTASALKMGLAAAGAGARVVQFSPVPPQETIDISPYEMYFKEVRLLPSYSCGPDDTREALKLISSGVLRAASLVSHTFPIREVARAYAVAQTPEALKVVVSFDKQ